MSSCLPSVVFFDRGILLFLIFNKENLYIVDTEYIYSSK